MLFDVLSGIVSRQRPTMAPAFGSRLTRIGSGAWVADRELIYGSRNRLPVRMVVLGGEASELCLYSPVALDDGTVEALAGLGQVRWIIVPNRFHTLFAGRAMDVYVASELLVPVSAEVLAERFPRRARCVLSPEVLGGTVEIMPVSLRKGFDELVLYHDASETLVLGDLIFNLHQGEGFARWLYRLNGVWKKPAQSRMQRLLLLKNRESLAELYRWAMSKPFSQISVAHGQIINRNARETFYQLFHRYLDSAPD